MYFVQALANWTTRFKYSNWRLYKQQSSAVVCMQSSLSPYQTHHFLSVHAPSLEGRTEVKFMKLINIAVALRTLPTAWETQSVSSIEPK